VISTFSREELSLISTCAHINALNTLINVQALHNVEVYVHDYRTTTLYLNYF